ncbi:Epoxide hydrolase EphG [Paraconexibacter sp. AEG42_29]|uniref:Epoxide hydrolase EphG n=1 Tax=Paraconexibacter sp. AEG42_29 TaxID=2997339 RepID=A0AAU7B1P9_9ACTN
MTLADAPSTPVATEDPVAVASRFLDLLMAGDLDAAADLLAPDVIYINVSLPKIVGRERVRKVAKATLGRPSAGFEVYIHATGADGHVALNERTDVLTVGPFRTQFWVYGRFEVVDGQITVWRDSFDWLNITLASLRGLAGIAIPALRAKPPVA